MVTYQRYDGKVCCCFVWLTAAFFSFFFCQFAFGDTQKAGHNHVVSVQTIDDDTPPPMPHIAKKKPFTAEKKRHIETSIRKKKNHDQQGDVSQEVHKNKHADVPHKSVSHVQRKETGNASPVNKVADQKPVKPPQPYTIHYASLRANKVNLRAGPGQRFPILWVYFRRGMPVRVLRDFDVWRYVEFPDKEKGWVMQTMLSAKRTFWIPENNAEIKKGDVSKHEILSDDIKVKSSDSKIVQRLPQERLWPMKKHHVFMYEKPTSSSRVIAVLSPGTIGVIKQCPSESQYCLVRVQNYEGWIPRHVLWGLDLSETYPSS